MRSFGAELGTKTLYNPKHPCTLFLFHFSFSSPVSKCYIYFFANYSLYLPEPLVLNHRGVSLRADTVLISQFLTSRLVDTCIYDDMTEYSYSDIGEGDLLEEQDDGPSEPQPRTKKASKDYQKRRSKQKRNANRSEVQKALGTSLKLHVYKKYLAQCIIDAILLDFDTPRTSEITLAGWVGQPLKDLPSRTYTLEELTKVFDFKIFPWEGRCVILLLLLL